MTLSRSINHKILGEVVMITSPLMTECKGEVTKVPHKPEFGLEHHDAA